MGGCEGTKKGKIKLEKRARRSEEFKPHLPHSFLFSSIHRIPARQKRRKSGTSIQFDTDMRCEGLGSKRQGC